MRDKEEWYQLLFFLDSLEELRAAPDLAWCEFFPFGDVAGFDADVFLPR